MIWIVKRAKSLWLSVDCSFVNIKVSTKVRADVFILSFCVNSGRWNIFHFHILLASDSFLSLRRWIFYLGEHSNLYLYLLPVFFWKSWQYLSFCFGMPIKRFILLQVNVMMISPLTLAASPNRRCREVEPTTHATRRRTWTRDWCKLSSMEEQPTEEAQRDQDAGALTYSITFGFRTQLQINHAYKPYI